jgi:hypothetical protein
MAALARPLWANGEPFITPNFVCTNVGSRSLVAQRFATDGIHAG